MNYTQRRRLFILALLCGFGFALRVYRLDAVPLRGDEAFTVRYWADSPGRVVNDLAHWEPHPFGAFFSFWGWKSLAGDSEFAMRYLPVLGSLIGLAAVAALAQMLFRSDRIASFAAAFWAVNPFLIWHAQDVRNYSLWAGISVLAMVLFIRAVMHDRPRDWALYAAAETAACYLFFLEVFLLPVQALFLLLNRPPRTLLRRALNAWAALGLLLIPWGIQLIWLAQSGYAGTLDRAAVDRLVTWFLPALLWGDRLPSPWELVIPALWIVLAVIAVITVSRQRRVVWWLVAWILIPVMLLIVVATRMSVFHPRYLITIIPALLLLAVQGLRTSDRHSLGKTAVQAILLLTPVIGIGYLVDYYQGESPKAPDWPGLVAYLDHRAADGDLLLQAAPDPAFGYYYRGTVAETSLKAGVAVRDQKIWQDIDQYHTIWLIGHAPEADAYLGERFQKLHALHPAGFAVSQYRAWEIKLPNESMTAAEALFGSAARLRGYATQGPDSASPTITLLLYWEPLAQTKAGYKVFTHLVAGDAVIAQDDHTPLYASTMTWPVGSVIRDPYIIDPGERLKAGDYSIKIGFYDPVTGDRLPVTDAAGNHLEGSYTLLTFHWPLP